MDSYIPDLESTQVKVSLAFAAYKSDTVRLVETSLAGMTYIVASRQGLYAANEQDCRLLVHGFFFGITLRGEDIFVFETCDLPRGPTRQGRLIRLTVRDQTIIAASVLFKGIDNGCHQIDFVDGRLVVIDTYFQQVLRFAEDLRSYETLHPLPVNASGRWRGEDPGYRHLNSVLAIGGSILLLLHNGAAHTDRNSEIVVCDRNWQETERWELQGSGCHGLALLENGTVLTCGSMEGNLISVQGWSLHISPFLTRGLAVGPDSFAIGASRLTDREGRLRNSGTITFFDRDPITCLPGSLRTVLEVPGAPTELRRLDGQDAGLSSYLAGVAWGTTLKRGTPE
jgi:hypothetical protein